MILEDLLKRLQSDKTKTRIQTAHIIGTLDEVAAMPVLATCFRQETDPQVQEALKWAGKRLKAAQDAGYSTLEAIVIHFNIAAEWSTAAQSDDERAKLEKIQHDAAMRALQQQEAAATKQALGRLAKGYMMGLPGLLMTTPMVPDLESDMIDAVYRNRVPLEKQRAMPTRPGDSDISMMVRRMMHEVDMNKRIKAAQNLARDTNNPAALPALAQVFVEDQKEAVRDAAQLAAKHIYWNAVYWEMESDGSMTAEIDRRRASVNSAAEASSALDAEPDRENIAEILRKAEEEKRKRRKR